MTRRPRPPVARQRGRGTDRRGFRARGTGPAAGPRRDRPGHRSGGGESACTPDSVTELALGGGHPSRRPVTRPLLRPTRE